MAVALAIARMLGRVGTAGSCLVGTYIACIVAVIILSMIVAMVTALAMRPWGIRC